MHKSELFLSLSLLRLMCAVKVFLPDIINIGFSFNNFSLYFTIITIIIMIILYLLYHKFMLVALFDVTVDGVFIVFFFISSSAISYSSSLCVCNRMYEYELCISFHSRFFFVSSFVFDIHIYSLQIDEFKILSHFKFVLQQSKLTVEM